MLENSAKHFLSRSVSRFNEGNSIKNIYGVSLVRGNKRLYLTSVFGEVEISLENVRQPTHFQSWKFQFGRAPQGEPFRGEPEERNR